MSRSGPAPYYLDDDDDDDLYETHQAMPVYFCTSLLQLLEKFVGFRENE